MTPQDLAAREVHYCVSSLVSTLAAGAYLDINIGHDHGTAAELRDLFATAAELAAPVDDWEEAAIQAGWHLVKRPDGPPQWVRGAGDVDKRHPNWFNGFLYAESAQEACGALDLDPYQREVFEHWIVSDWLADKLEAHGEKVERDLAGLTVWARTTTGQAIYADGVIEAITAENWCSKPPT